MNHYSAISDKSSAQLENLGYQTLNYTVHTWNLKIKAISSCASDSDMSEIKPENGYQVLIESTIYYANGQGKSFSINSKTPRHKVKFAHQLGVS